MLDPLCWQNGEIISAEKASICVLDHGLLYGDGVFEGIPVYNGQPFKLAEHLRRLFDSAKAIRLEPGLSEAFLTDAIDALVAAYQQPSAYIRVVLTRGVGSMGIDPRSCAQPGLFIIIGQIGVVSDAVRGGGAKIIIASTRRTATDALDARIKSLNYLNNIMAKMEANLAGADEAILLNSMGRITEGSSDNIFIVRSGVLLTPPSSEGVLAGITREFIINCAKKSGLTCREEPLTPYDLYTADECFLTGTGAELIPVASVDGRSMSLCPGPTFRLLKQAFEREITRAS